MKIILTPRQLMNLIEYAQRTGELSKTPITLSSDSIKLYYRYINQLQEALKRKT